MATISIGEVAVIVIFLSLRYPVQSTILYVGGDCQELLNSFAKYTSDYTMCTMMNARPIKVCENCIDMYLDVHKSYNQLLKLYDEFDNQCKEEILNLDRLQVVDKGYRFVEDLWHKASCSECFKKDEHGATISNLTDTTVKLISLSDNTKACISNHENSTGNSSQTICNECKDEYLELNNYYNRHRTRCMDIVDLVNTTRYQWSSTLGCCLDRRKIEEPFLIYALNICLLPILLYTFMYFYTKRAKLNSVIEQNRWQSGCTSVNS